MLFCLLNVMFWLFSWEKMDGFWNERKCLRITFDLWNSVEQAGSVKKSSFISSRRFFLTSRVSEFGECTECESLLHYYWSQLHFPEFETKFFSHLQERFFKELTWKCTFTFFGVFLFCSSVVLSFWDKPPESGRFQSGPDPPHFVRQNFVTFCGKISFSPRVGVAFTNDKKRRPLGPSRRREEKYSMCTHQAHDGKYDLGLEWKKSDAAFGGRLYLLNKVSES